MRYLYFNFCIFPAFVVLVGFANFTQCAICRSIVAGCCRSLKPMRILQSGMGKIVLICRFIICWALFEVKGCSSKWMKYADTVDYRNGLASKLHTVSAMEWQLQPRIFKEWMFHFLCVLQVIIQGVLRQLKLKTIATGNTFLHN